MGYFPKVESSSWNLQTQIRAKATNTSVFGAGRQDKKRCAKKSKKGGVVPQTEEFESDIVGLEEAQEKKAQITRVPPEDKFLIGTVLTDVDNEQAAAGNLTFQVVKTPNLIKKKTARRCGGDDEQGQNRISKFKHAQNHQQKAA